MTSPFDTAYERELSDEAERYLHGIVEERYTCIALRWITRLENEFYTPSENGISCADSLEMPPC